MNTPSIYAFTVQDHQGNPYPMEALRNKAILIVNTASKCGFTKQYEGLEALHKSLEGRLQILGFPCNQFGGQEPGSNEDIQSFCKLTYQTSFPVLAKINVNGPDTDPLYQYLKQALPGLGQTTAIKWNFTKFLVSPTGIPVQRFAPQDSPESLVPHIQALFGTSHEML